MKKLEEFIYSVKYLPSILYFGSFALLGYDIYLSVKFTSWSGQKNGGFAYERSTKP